MTLPDWASSALAAEAKIIRAGCRSPAERKILQNLLTDSRMGGVWQELTKRDRSGGGRVNQTLDWSDRGQDAAQAAALAATFHFAFCAARDRVSTSKETEAASLREGFLARAANLRAEADLLLRGQSLAPFLIFRPDIINSQAYSDADSLRRLARHLEAAAANLRGQADPLTTPNERGDRVERGVQIVCGAFLLQTFGKRLDGTAATLAAVVLGIPTPSARKTRSAFSKRKSA